MQKRFEKEKSKKKHWQYMFVAAWPWPLSIIPSSLIMMTLNPIMSLWNRSRKLGVGWNTNGTFLFPLLSLTCNTSIMCILPPPSSLSVCSPCVAICSDETRAACPTCRHSPPRGTAAQYLYPSSKQENITHLSHLIWGKLCPCLTFLICQCPRVCGPCGVPMWSGFHLTTHCFLVRVVASQEAHLTSNSCHDPREQIHHMIVQSGLKITMIFLYEWKAVHNAINPLIFWLLQTLHCNNVAIWVATIVHKMTSSKIIAKPAFYFYTMQQFKASENIDLT